jgi:hypothetical protein
MQTPSMVVLALDMRYLGMTGKREGESRLPTGRKKVGGGMMDAFPCPEVIQLRATWTRRAAAQLCNVCLMLPSGW